MSILVAFCFGIMCSLLTVAHGGWNPFVGVKSSVVLKFQGSESALFLF